MTENKTPLTRRELLKVGAASLAFGSALGGIGFVSDRVLESANAELAKTHPTSDPDELANRKFVGNREKGGAQGLEILGGVIFASGVKVLIEAVKQPK